MYTQVESLFWKDEKFQHVSGDARYLMLYLLTSPHRNILGLYFLPSPYACFDLGWDEQKFKQILHELVKTERIKHDHQNNVILICNYLKHNPLENPNQVKSAINRLNELPKTYLLKDFSSILNLFNKPFIEPLKERLAELLGKPEYRIQEQNTETESSGGIYNTEVKEKDAAAEKNPLIIIQKALQKAGILTPSAYQIECLLAWHDEGIELDVITLAIKKAALSNNPRVNYIEGILKDLSQQGIKTLAQAEAADQEFQQRKRGSPSRAPTGPQQPRQKTDDELHMESLMREIEAGSG